MTGPQCDVFYEVDAKKVSLHPFAKEGGNEVVSRRSGVIKAGNVKVVGHYYQQPEAQGFVILTSQKPRGDKAIDPENKFASVALKQLDLLELGGAWHARSKLSESVIWAVQRADGMSPTARDVTGSTSNKIAMQRLIFANGGIRIWFIILTAVWVNSDKGALVSGEVTAECVVCGASNLSWRVSSSESSTELDSLVEHAEMHAGISKTAKIMSALVSKVKLKVCKTCQRQIRINDDPSHGPYNEHSSLVHCRGTLSDPNVDVGEGAVGPGVCIAKSKEIDHSPQRGFSVLVKRGHLS